MGTLLFIFLCQDNTYLTFKFDTYINSSCSDSRVKALIQAIIDNGTIFTHVPIKCVFARKYTLQIDVSYSSLNTIYKDCLSPVITATDWGV